MIKLMKELIKNNVDMTFEPVYHTNSCGLRVRFRRQHESCLSRTIDIYEIERLENVEGALENMLLTWLDSFLEEYC